MTPEPRLEARCASSGSCSPKNRRKRGSLRSGCRGERISLEVKMLTTDGVARRTASLYDSARSAAGEVGALPCTMGTETLVFVGSHSGRKVDTTNSTATAIVAACAKISQRRSSMGAASIRKFPSKLSGYALNHGHWKSAPLQSRAFAPRHNNSIPMNEHEKVDKTRRNLVVATSVVGGAAGVGVAAPFVASMWPSDRARAAGAPIEVDLTRIAPGELAVFEWRGKPVWVLRRTPEMV